MRFIFIIILTLLVLSGNFWLQNNKSSSGCLSQIIRHAKTFKSERDISIKSTVRREVMPVQPDKFHNLEASDSIKKITPVNDNFLSETTRKNRSIINSKVGENYIDSILSNGKLVRWNPATFPIIVYIENSSKLPPYYYQQIRKAFEKWQSVSNNFITFIFTDIKENSDIRCTFPANFERKCGVSNVAAWHKYIYKNNMIKYSDIRFARVSCQKTLYSPESVYVTALHEIGHSLGLSGHSSNPKDLMYPITSKNLNISDNDLRTLRLLYSIVPDITNTPISQLDKKGLITPDDIWGSKEGRIDMQLQDIKDKVENVSSPAYSEYAKLGDLYVQKGDYEKAVNCYIKSLDIATDKSNIALINKRIAIVYVKMKKFKEALSYAKKSYELNPDDDGIVFIAGIQYELENYEEAKQILRNLLNQNPKVYNAYLILGNIYLKEKDYKSVKSLYERGKTHFPDNPPIKLEK